MPCYMGLDHPKNKLRWSVSIFLLVSAAACFGGFFLMRSSCSEAIKAYVQDQELEELYEDQTHLELHFPGEEIAAEHKEEHKACLTNPTVYGWHCFGVCNAMVILEYAWIALFVSSVIPLIVMCLCTKRPEVAKSSALDPKTGTAELDSQTPPAEGQPVGHNPLERARSEASSKMDSMKLPPPPPNGIPAVLWDSNQKLDDSAASNV